jgi:hypothetical protein
MRGEIRLALVFLVLSGCAPRIADRAAAPPAAPGAARSAQPAAVDPAPPGIPAPAALAAPGVVAGPDAPRQRELNELAALRKALEEERHRLGEMRLKLSECDQTVRELRAQLEDARRSAGQIIEDVRKYSTSQVSAMHAEARVMVERMEADRKSPRAMELAGYAREHLRAAEELLGKKNNAAAAFYFAQISGIYSRYQKRNAP